MIVLVKTPHPRTLYRSRSNLGTLGVESKQNSPMNSPPNRRQPWLNSIVPSLILNGLTTREPQVTVMSGALRQTPPRSPQKHGGCLEKEEEHGLRHHADPGLNPFLAMWPQAGHLIILSPSCLKTWGLVFPRGVCRTVPLMLSQLLLWYTSSRPPTTSAVN